MFKQLIKGSSSKKRNDDEDVKVEEFIDVEQQIEKFKKEKLELIPGLVWQPNFLAKKSKSY